MMNKPSAEKLVVVDKSFQETIDANPNVFRVVKNDNPTISNPYDTLFAAGAEMFILMIDLPFSFMQVYYADEHNVVY